MKKIPDKERKFPYRIWFETGEIDSLMENHLAEFSTKVKQIKEPPIPVELFVEKYICAEFDNYAVLKTDTDNILGATYFKDSGIAIKIDKSLTESVDSNESTGRYNFTVSHEAFHAIYHKELFAKDKNQLEFSGFTKRQKIECLGRDLGIFSEKTNTKTPWWEVQANMGAAALLMPKTMFLEHFIKERNAYGIADNYKLASQKDTLYSVVSYLSNTFSASMEAVRIRLSQLGCITDTRQGEFFSDVQRIGEILRG